MAILLGIQPSGRSRYPFVPRIDPPQFSYAFNRPTTIKNGRIEPLRQQLPRLRIDVPILPIHSDNRNAHNDFAHHSVTTPSSSTVIVNEYASMTLALLTFIV